MSLLSRYVCGAFVRFFGLGLSMCVALFLLIELFDRIDNFISRQVLWRDAVLYLALRLPMILYLMMPAACLLASVLTFSTLNKHNEIVPMRAAGIAPLRLMRVLFGLGGVACLVLLLAQEYVLPYANRTGRQLWRTRMQRQKVDVRLGLFKQGHIWHRSANRIWSVRHSQPLENRLLGVTIYAMDANGAIRRRYDAAEAAWNPPGWVLRQGTQRAFDASGDFTGPPEPFTERQVPFLERPLDISARKKEPDEMGIRETLAYARQVRRQGRSDARYVVEFHGKLAFAAVCIIMAGFGAPLALASNRSGGAARAIALTLGCGFSYWIVHSLAMALGQNGQLPPVLAAWLGNICFGAGSLYLAVRAQ